MSTYANGEVLFESIVPNFVDGKAERLTMVAKHIVEIIDIKPGETFLNPADRKRYVYTGPVEGWLKILNDKWGF